MKVRALKRCAGGFNFAPGEELNLPKDEAALLIEAGAVESLSKPEPVAKKAPKPAQRRARRTSPAKDE